MDAKKERDHGRGLKVRPMVFIFLGKARSAGLVSSSYGLPMDRGEPRADSSGMNGGGRMPGGWGEFPLPPSFTPSCLLDSPQCLSFFPSLPPASSLSPLPLFLTSSFSPSPFSSFPPPNALPSFHVVIFLTIHLCVGREDRNLG